MIIIRHNTLKPPYDDYTKLSLQQMDQLATHQVSPPIQDIPSTLIMDRFAPLFTTGRSVWCSDSLRTSQTYLAISQVLNNQNSHRIEPNLNEITFSPLALMDDPSQNPLQAIRNHLYDWIAQRRAGIEDYDLLQKRMDHVLDHYQNTDAICFSHGFFIRLLIAYVQSNRNMDKALEYAQGLQPIDYLQIVTL
jgi:broad specificity phosphatase PhoE